MSFGDSGVAGCAWRYAKRREEVYEGDVECDESDYESRKLSEDELG